MRRYHGRIRLCDSSSRETSSSKFSRTNLRSVPRLRNLLTGRAIFCYLLLFFTGSVIFGAASISLAQQSCTFLYRSPNVGQQWMHDVRLDTSMKTRFRYPDQEPQEFSSVEHRHQRRRLTILATAPKQVSKVKVKFEKALKKVLNQGETDARWHAQPVDGKTYLVTRSGADLVVTDEQGKKPPEDERKIVEHSMQAIGRPNPIAKFLHERTISVGDTIHLPADLVSDLLGSQNKVDDAQIKMPMKLVHVKDVEGVLCGVFETEIDNSVQFGVKTSTRMKGQFAVELGTCRIVSVSFRGPITHRQSRLIAGQQYTVEATGSLAVAMQASRLSR